jgi:hypothetical protein
MADAERETVEVGAGDARDVWAIIHYLDYWGRVINRREYWPDGSYYTNIKYYDRY